MSTFFRELFRDSVYVSVSMLKLLIPVIILGKIFIELGGVGYFAIILGPPMQALGLPPELSLVWATTILTNLTGGILILIELMRTQTYTVEQITILSTLMLAAHSLPVEARVAQRAGLRLGVTLLTRVGGGFLLALILHVIYSRYGLLQQEFSLNWQPSMGDDSLYSWAISQVIALATLIVAIVVLLFVLRILKVIGVERIMVLLLTPILRFIGMRKEAATITIVGMTLGLSYGGGLLINETAKGYLTRQDIFASLTLLNLCHSMIDDTLLILLLGAHESAAVWARLVFSILFTALVVRIARMIPVAIWDRYIVAMGQQRSATHA